MTNDKLIYLVYESTFDKRFFVWLIFNIHTHKKKKKKKRERKQWNLISMDFVLLFNWYSMVVMCVLFVCDELTGKKSVTEITSYHECTIDRSKMMNKKIKFVICFLFFVCSTFQRRKFKYSFDRNKMIKRIWKEKIRCVSRANERASKKRKVNLRLIDIQSDIVILLLWWIVKFN